MRPQLLLPMVNVIDVLDGIRLSWPTLPLELQCCADTGKAFTLLGDA